MKASLTKTGALKAFLLSLFLLPTALLQGQSLDEWFRQKKTQREYLVQQIAALQAYTGVLREGYTILRQGTSTVEHIKHGDLGLHQAFFGSLQRVNPLIGGSPRVTDILRYQEAIARTFRETLPALRQSPLLQAIEREHLEEVKAKVLSACARDLEELRLLLRENELEMPDEARLQRLEALYRNTHDTFRFTRSFLEEARVLLLWRAREQQGLHNTRSLHGLLP